MKLLKYSGLFLFFLLSCFPVLAQDDNDEAVKLLGELTQIRENFDVLSYSLDVEVLPEEKRIEGSNTILFQAVEDIDEIQIDLFDNMQVNGIYRGNESLEYERKHHSIFIDLGEELEKDSEDSIRIEYGGQPIEARNAPWDGGFVWETDSLGNPWVGVAVEGLGASSWWPNKDHLSDEPDQGVKVAITVPADLNAVSNGRLVGKEDIGENKTKYIWKTFYPIDNYNVTVNVGDYVHYKEYYEGIPERNESGIFQSQEGRPLDIDYYVLSYNVEKAKEHFDFTEDVLQAFEYAYGPYPFYEDGFAIVETPYLGMEHQGAIAYGNDYQMGYDGKLAEPYLEWDYLFVHEVAHEWWGNNVSMEDRADMWIQESFATYSDAFYAVTTYGYQGYLDMMDYFKTLVKNERPIVGEYGRNDKGDIDMYYKGALMLSTLSQLVEDNELWLGTLRKAQAKFGTPNTIGTDEFIQFLEDEFRLELTPFFNQYLRTTSIPKLIVRKKESDGKEYLIYKWVNVVDNFDMPVRLQVEQFEQEWIYPEKEWKKVELPKDYSKQFLGIENRAMYFDVDFK